MLLNNGTLKRGGIKCIASRERGAETSVNISIPPFHFSPADRPFFVIDKINTGFIIYL